MDKVFKVKDKRITQRFIELPLGYAAELFARTCRECYYCTLDDQRSTVKRAPCPFNDRECSSITREDWEEYLNE